ncbi:uncharacterized protein LOC110850843 [Folsomia candida]|uniref:GH16 domain-containing protein n=1 Tax=Folsomia candida TaxID=158441 RepID=A0A226EWV0_FOLCA|nr:uncharacterized protein LOC110850843 [Folsomia candida]OXA61544.1 hypothetical protein Fcan01_00682 [Folsomia candida]
MTLSLTFALISTLLSFTVAQFTENWASTTSPTFVTYGTHGSPESAFADPAALDGRALRLTLNANPPAGVGGAPAAETYGRFKYGTYWTRAKTGNCSNQPLAGVVSGIFTYFNDQGDRNGNGIADNSEIDFEWLCADPKVVHLSIWTDYQESNPPNIRVVYRTIDLSTGRVQMECYREQFGECRLLSGPERQPATVTPISGYDSSTEYFWYGLEFAADRVHFMIRGRNDEVITLWDYRGPAARMPNDEMHFMHNVWHTNNWWPEGDDGTMIESPRSPVYMFVDSSSFTPL